MIVPSNALITHIRELYNNDGEFAKRIGIDPTLLSRLIKKERSASAFVIEKVHSETGFAFTKAWEITE